MNQNNSQEQQAVQTEQTTQSEPFDPKLVNEESEKEMELANGKCGACKRRGFPLFLVRKSIVPNTFKTNISWTKEMTSLGEREPKNTNWQDYHYAYRTLREGYVYILCNPIGNMDDSKLDIMAYEVTHSGAFRLRELRDIKGSRPLEIPKSCITDKHNIKALFVTIDNRKYDKAWVAYSPVRWEMSAVNYYRDPSNFAKREQRFSEVDLMQKAAEDVSSKQKRSFKFRDFLDKARYLLELECDAQTVQDYFKNDAEEAEPSAIKLANTNTSGIAFLDTIRQGVMLGSKLILSDLFSSTKQAISNFFTQVFYTASHFNSLNHPDAREALQSTASQYEHDKNYGTELTALVVEDSFGLAEELAIQRRQRLAPIAEGLAGFTEKSDDTLNQYRHLVRGSSHDVIYAQERTQPHNELATAMQKSGGRDKFAQYYQDKLSSSKSYPLAYFTPEINYARNHYRHIEQYKASIRSSITEKGDNDTYLFLFYNAAQNYRLGHDGEPVTAGSIAENNQQYTDVNRALNAGHPLSQKEMSALKDIDKINVLDVVGEEAIAQKLEIELVNTWEYRGYSNYNPTLNPGYLYCRRISLVGLPSQSTKAPLGEYQELILSDDQQKALLAQYTKAQRSGGYVNRVDSVKVVQFGNLTGTKNTLADNKLADDWKKREKRLNQPSVDNYKQLEKEGYESLFKYANDSSNDYYHYLIWLFGEEANHYQVEQGGLKAPLPKALNTLLFWRQEILPTSSDMHINMLLSFLVIFDSDSIGTMTLPLHAALWGMLFNNEASIYFHLLGDIKPKEDSNNTDEESYWNSQVKGMQDDVPSNKKAAPKSPTMQQSQNTDSQSTLGIEGVGGKDLYDIAKGISTAERKNNHSMVKLLIEKMLSTSLEGVNKAVSNQVQINDLMARSHFLKAMNLFKGSNVERIRQYQVTMTVKGLQQYLKKMDELTPFFFSEQMTTNKGTLLSVMKNQQERLHIPQSGNKAIANQKVTVNILMAFDEPGAQAKFEAALKKSPNGSFANATLKEIQTNIIEVGDTVFNDADIDTLSAAITRNKRYVEVLDTSATFVLGLVSLYFQMNALQSLQKQLDTNPDPLVKLKVMMSYGAVMSASTELTMQFIIATSSSSDLFFGRGASLYSFFSQHLKKIQTIGKSIGLIDSILSVALSWKSVNEGNTGSGVYLVTSLLSLCVSGAAFFAIPIWGQIALVFVGIGLAIISALYYSDGSDWDEIDKWLNRSMLGNFDFYESKYPPYYLPTPICMQLSQQDYYLAVNGGRCLLESESGLMSNRYDIYLDLRLPDFNSEKSEFEGTVTIKPIIGESVTLNISDGPMQLNIKQTTPVSVAKRLVGLTDFFSVATEPLDSNKELYNFYKEVEKKLGKDEVLWNELMAVTTGQALLAATPPTADADNMEEIKIGLFLIKQRLGQINGVHNVMISVNYWPNGKIDKEGQEITPYLFSHHYTKITKVSVDEKNTIN